MCIHNTVTYNFIGCERSQRSRGRQARQPAWGGLRETWAGLSGRMHLKPSGVRVIDHKPGSGSLDEHVFMGHGLACHPAVMAQMAWVVVSGERPQDAEAACGEGSLGPPVQAQRKLLSEPGGHRQLESPDWRVRCLPLSGWGRHTNYLKATDHSALSLTQSGPWSPFWNSCKYFLKVISSLTQTIKKYIFFPSFYIPYF